MKKMICLVLLLGFSITANAGPVRKYYLTTTQVNGNQTLPACANGYHMASLWEILDTSNLKYNTNLGLTADDSGFGPPNNVEGWIRTGGTSVNFAGVTGVDNCNAWTTTSGTGTTLFLPNIWTGSAKEISPWSGGVLSCNQLRPVWCMEN